jgi:hypothetical protein
MSHSDTHHSFSVELAIKYGIEQAIIIHHFQHWIKLNRRKKSAKHFINNRWWTYQKRSDIQAILPYLTEDGIRHHCEELVRKGVLHIGKFNKLKIDKTLWYAFVDENLFLGEEDSNNPYERGKPQSTGENPNPFGENPKAIPDPNSSDPRITDKDLNSSSQFKNQSNALAEEFYFALKDAHGDDFKKPNLESWSKHFDSMLRIDEREPSMIRKVMNWAVLDSFWKPNILSAKKLREKFLTLKLQMERPANKKSLKSEEAIWNRQEADIPAENDILKQLLVT